MACPAQLIAFGHILCIQTATENNMLFSSYWNLTINRDDKNVFVAACCLDAFANGLGVWFCSRVCSQK